MKQTMTSRKFHNYEVVKRSNSCFIILWNFCEVIASFITFKF